MKKRAVKMIALLCMFCMAAGSMTAFAAEITPTISVAVDADRKNAEITLNSVPFDIYSVQIAFSMTGGDYTLTAAGSPATEVTVNGRTVTVYLASSSLLNEEGKTSVLLGQLTSEERMSINSTASKMVLVNRDKKPVEYTNVPVKVTYLKELNTPVKRPSNTSNQTSGGNVMYFPGENTQSGFADITGHWAAPSITYVVEKGLFNGTSQTTFEPDTNMTRGMYVTVLKRFGTAVDAKWNIPCDAPRQFADIAADDWYADAVAWAGGVGIVNGIDAEQFGPDIAITREQIAVMTVKFAQQAGVPLPAVNPAAAFTDAADMHDWAVEAVDIAQRAGLIYGREQGNFAPRDTATRAEVATILQRFAELTK